MSADVSDGDLARLARGGDPAAFRLLVERHQPMVRARARQLASDPGDVDDIVQESFLQAFLALDRLRDPDRFAGWLAGIVFNVCRSLRRRAPVTLLADWPEPLHPTSAGGLPSAEDLDRADALRAAVAGLPAGQRRAVTLHYYADVPAGQVAEAPGAARASLHKARLKLRAYLTEHRPDLVPASGRTYMTTVRVARIERRIPPGPVPDRFPTHVIVLADDAAAGTCRSGCSARTATGSPTTSQAERGRADRPAAARGRDPGDRGGRRRAGPGGDRGPDRAGHPGRPRAGHRAAARRPGHGHHLGRADPGRRRGHGPAGGAGRGLRRPARCPSRRHVTCVSTCDRGTSRAT